MDVAKKMELPLPADPNQGLQYLTEIGWPPSPSCRGKIPGEPGWKVSGTLPPLNLIQREEPLLRGSKVRTLGSQFSSHFVCRKKIPRWERQAEKIRGYLFCLAPGVVAYRFSLRRKTVPKNRILWNSPQKAEFIWIRVWTSSTLSMLSTTIEILVVSM